MADATAARRTATRITPRCASLSGQFAARIKVRKPAREAIDGVRRAGHFAERSAAKAAGTDATHARRASQHAGFAFVAHRVARRLQISRHVWRIRVGDDDPLRWMTADDTCRAGARAPVHWMETSP
ncbi:MAG TPA: hypothetical protein VJR91_13660 [Burkholderia sp.]|nr:hypothetical protein [Burkholderia sp.]